MQALTLPQAVTCRACGSRRAHLQSLAAPARPARRPHGGYRAASAFAGAAAAFSSEPDYLGGLASAVGLLLAGGLAWTLAQVRSASQEEAVHDDRPECATCGGTGLEDCACRRWSDGDVGCSTCRGTGKSVCRSCNGGGTAVPIAARAPKRNVNSYDTGSRQ